MTESRSVLPPVAVRVASALFEIEASDPGKRPRQVLWAVCGLIGVLVIWACFAKLDIVAVANGKLVPESYLKIVQPAQAGVIREILVEEGDDVEQDQVLIRLDRTVNSADLVALSQELDMHRLELRRVEAELAGASLPKQSGDDPQLYAQVEARYLSHRQEFLDSLAQETAGRDRSVKELEAATELYEKLERTLPSYMRSAEAYESLAEEHLVGALEADERRRQALEKAQDVEAQRATVAGLQAAIAQHDRRLEQVKSAYASDLSQTRLQTAREIHQLEQQLGKLRYQADLLELKAPQAGVVKGLATTTLGAVVQPGTVLLSLVPQDEPLLAEVLVQNKDIGFVAPNQPVRIKIDAYPFQKYGMIEGAVRHVSADSSGSGASSGQGTDLPDGELVFKALVILEDQGFESDDFQLPLTAGMQVTAEIMQGKRTVLEYLLSPVQRVVSEAGMER